MKKRFVTQCATLSTREAGVRQEPGVERSGTPGIPTVNRSSPRRGRQSHAHSVARFTGWRVFGWATLGFRSRSTPGYCLTPTPSAEESVRA
jgi:hypothetical protein